MEVGDQQPTSATPICRRLCAPAGLWVLAKTACRAHACPRWALPCRRRRSQHATVCCPPRPPPRSAGDLLYDTSRRAAGRPPPAQPNGRPCSLTEPTRCSPPPPRPPPPPRSPTAAPAVQRRPLRHNRRAAARPAAPLAAGRHAVSAHSRGLGAAGGSAAGGGAGHQGWHLAPTPGQPHGRLRGDAQQASQRRQRVAPPLRHMRSRRPCRRICAVPPATHVLRDAPRSPLPPPPPSAAARRPLPRSGTRCTAPTHALLPDPRCPPRSARIPTVAGKAGGRHWEALAAAAAEDPEKAAAKLFSQVGALSAAKSGMERVGWLVD